MGQYSYYWGTPTASLDWCETNYSVSPYVAEFWNTLSSLYISAVAMLGAYLSYKQKAETKMQIAWFLLWVVGIGSALFHATLLYANQLADELPMIYGSLVFVYVCIEHPSFSESFRKWIILLLILYGGAVTFIMLTHRDNPLLHQFAYAFLVFCLIIRSGYISYKQQPMSEREAAVFRFLYWTALLTYGAGYLSWITERKFCVDGSVIPHVQLHSVWHIFTGTGTFIWIQHAAYYRLWVQRRAADAHVRHFMGMIPYVEPRTSSKKTR